MHYSVLILSNESLDRSSAHDVVETALEPFDENREDNPDGQWDWWQIGGRWSGTLDGYKPENDPANAETNPLLGKVKWPTAWAEHEGDVQRVADLSPTETMESSIAVVLTPDGIWHGRRWDGNTFQNGRPTLAELFIANPDAVAIVVDCHS